MGGCGKKPMLAINVNTSNFLITLWETPPKALCRTDRSTGEG